MRILTLTQQIRSYNMNTYTYFVDVAVVVCFPFEIDRCTFKLKWISHWNEKKFPDFLLIYHNKRCCRLSISFNYKMQILTFFHKEISVNWSSINQLDCYNRREWKVLRMKLIRFHRVKLLGDGTKSLLMHLNFVCHSLIMFLRKLLKGVIPHSSFNSFLSFCLCVCLKAENAFALIEFQNEQKKKLHHKAIFLFNR